MISDFGQMFAKRVFLFNSLESTDLNIKIVDLFISIASALLSFVILHEIF